ncbi:hypothetical protein ABN97_004349 [Salmonella enterica subsp. salamae]|nr:hypothetical protein [Salmonella enterica subsp. salamae]EEE2766872.1 hypothetical protein [Salmonella enterica subsp. diarizonae]EEJ6656555.1 hypothetical protein [Salmonella enterica subsp. enterica serovar Redlands]
MTMPKGPQKSARSAPETFRLAKINVTNGAKKLGLPQLGWRKIDETF